MTSLSEYIQLVLEARPSESDPSSDMDWSPGWHSWPSSVQHIPFESGHLHIGPGEHRAAALVGGEVQGGATSYDVVGADGKKWEVKKPTGWQVRASAVGKEMISRARGDYVYAIRKLIASLEKTKGVVDLSELFSVAELGNLETFIKDDVPQIMKGGLSRGRMERFREILLMFRDKFHKSKGKATKQKHIELGDEDKTIRKDVDLPTYVKVGDVANISKDELNVDNEAVLANIFRSYPFREPEEFMRKNWDEVVTAEDVFGHVDGMIMVSADGYIVVPKAELNDALKFIRVSQGDPYFTVTDGYR